MTTTRGLVSPINATVAYSASSVTLFNANRNVTYRSVVNNTDKTAYMYFSASAATATTANTVVLTAGQTFVFPTPVYNNIVTIIGAAAGSGSYNTTEYAAAS